MSSSAGARPGPPPGARRCCRSACPRPAVATLTYVYADSTAVLGSLSASPEPHTYDLCAPHAERLTAPRGWEVVRLAPDVSHERRSDDDLLALADAVRDAARPRASDAQGSGAGPGGAARGPVEPPAQETARRGHLRVLRDAGGPRS
ncbi:DUF3499 domain-containing protein [uncultured Pseudokineococcus sp.]|uniref:DUF3499 domain-containing protein n=1 Tax=uncultured Pseudokineococcus sp. TaxID=1642928 RepID=UPI00260CD6A3|nr:DUF3499 domain-containing protein [uncultured Pseudokineococcus sp.]